MVVARASGMDLASSLRQNTFLTLGVRPVGGPGSARDGGTEGAPGRGDRGAPGRGSATFYGGGTPPSCGRTFSMGDHGGVPPLKSTGLTPHPQTLLK